MIHIKAVAWTLPVAHTRQSTVEAVTKPIHDKTESCEIEEQWVRFGCYVATTRQHQSHQPEGGEMVRIDPGRQPIRQPQQHPLFRCGEHALLYARRWFEFRLRCRSRDTTHRYWY